MNPISATVVIIALFVVTFVIVKLSDRDDSDPPGGRSGLVIYTDNLTGCQYLRTSSSSLTPRLDATSKQVCTKETK